MNQSILLESSELKINDFKKMQVVQAGKVHVEVIPFTKPQLFKATSISEDVMNFYNLGREVAISIFVKTSRH